MSKIHSDKLFTRQLIADAGANPYEFVHLAAAKARGENIRPADAAQAIGSPEAAEAAREEAITRLMKIKPEVDEVEG